MLVDGVPTGFSWMTRAVPRLLLAAGQGAHLPDDLSSSRLAPSKGTHLNSRVKATRSLSSVPSLTWASLNLTPAKLSTCLVTCPDTSYTSLRLRELAATLGLSPHKSIVYLRRSLDLEVCHSTAHSARTRAYSSVRDTDPWDRGTVQILSRVRFAWTWSRRILVSCRNK